MLNKQKIPFIATLTAVLISTSFASLASTASHEPRSNQFWFPDVLDLTPLRQHAPQSNPMGKDFDYAKEFQTLDLDEVKADIKTLLTDSQDFWPADFGTYAAFFVRMTWHMAGTYRIWDGKGGAGHAQQRFEPLNSWPDNANLDKARRLLWPIKQKYGEKLSWADLFVLTGNVSLQSMGFEPFGFGGGRVDQWEADWVFWGPEKEFLADERQRQDPDGKIEKPLASTEMGLIYVNPQGPNGNPDPLLAANDIREAFGSMAMNDEETVALIAGGHTFGKAHGAGDPNYRVEGQTHVEQIESALGPAPAEAPIEEQGLGWHNSNGTGKGADTNTSGLEGAWSATPTTWSNQYLDNLFNYDWKLTESPTGAKQWTPKEESAANLVPDAFDPAKRHAPMMFTTDIALKEDPSYQKIAKRFQENPEEFKQAFSKAWYKLTHRDMGPYARYVGADVPTEKLIWQDPIPAVDYQVIEDTDVTQLKSQILATGLTVPELVRTAWASASTFRGSDMRGGSNGARVSLSPQKNWLVNNPEELAKVLGQLETIQQGFNQSQSDGKKVSLADVIILGGVVGVEKAAKDGGHEINLPFRPGRNDALQEQTDEQSFEVLKPTADGFRNYYEADNPLPPTHMLIHNADALTLTVPEMTVLLGGMRSLNANYDGSSLGILTDKPGTLSNDFFVNLLDMSTKWSKSKANAGTYEGRDRSSNEVKWTASSYDLIIGSSSELRAVAEVYGAADAQQKFVDDFGAAWTKVMNLDSFGQY